MVESLDMGALLQNAPQDVPKALEVVAEQNRLRQEVEGDVIRWMSPEGRVAILFFVVPDPRDLKSVFEPFRLTQETGCVKTYIYVHQWTDGEANWDSFTITPDRALRHGGRFPGTREIKERGPALREDIYTLFAHDQPFPRPGCARWAELLDGPREGLTKRLGEMAEERGCAQWADAETILWRSPGAKPEAMFFLLSNAGDLDGTVRIYEQIRDRDCPVSFVFVKQLLPGEYGVFRLSARSYLEHQTEIKPDPGS